MSKKIILFTLIVFFIKEIIWIALIPIWHFPDEQAHFAQVAYLAEIGRQPGISPNDLTEEIRISEKLLGTERDSGGNNSFTFRPEYKLKYSANFEGIHENKIKDASIDLKNRQMVKHEASNYPPLYYLILAVLYKIFYFSDLFTRVFILRISQIIYYLGTIYCTYLSAKLLFGKDLRQAFTVVILLAFHPMYSFVSAGINSDSLSNFIFSLFIFISLKIIKGPVTIKKMSESLFIILLSLYVKPQFYITLPLLFLIIIYKLIFAKIKQGYKFTSLGLVIVLSYFFLGQILKSSSGGGLLINKFLAVYNFTGLVDQFFNYSIPHLYKEVMPWYWGIFKWLGVTYPRYVHRTINWLVLISCFGLLIFFLRNFKKIAQWPQNGIVYLIITNVLFTAGVYLFDYLQFVASGFKFHLGVQGRYFFPLLFSQMVLITIGWNEIFVSIPKLKSIILGLLSGFMIILHWYALIFISASYYDISSYNIFLIQASQYKPWYFKGIFLTLILLISFTLNLVFLIKYFRFFNSNEKKTTK